MKSFVFYISFSFLIPVDVTDNKANLETVGVEGEEEEDWEDIPEEEDDHERRDNDDDDDDYYDYDYDSQEEEEEDALIRYALQGKSQTF